LKATLINFTLANWFQIYGPVIDIYVLWYFTMILLPVAVAVAIAIAATGYCRCQTVS